MKKFHYLFMILLIPTNILAEPETSYEFTKFSHSSEHSNTFMQSFVEGLTETILLESAWFLSSHILITLVSYSLNLGPKLKLQESRAEDLQAELNRCLQLQFNTFDPRARAFLTNNPGLSQEGLKNFFEEKRESGMSQSDLINRIHDLELRIRLSDLTNTFLPIDSDSTHDYRHGIAIPFLKTILDRVVVDSEASIDWGKISGRAVVTAMLFFYLNK